MPCTYIQPMGTQGAALQNLQSGGAAVSLSALVKTGTMGEGRSGTIDAWRKTMRAYQSAMRSSVPASITNLQENAI